MHVRDLCDTALDTNLSCEDRIKQIITNVTGMSDTSADELIAAAKCTLLHRIIHGDSVDKIVDDMSVALTIKYYESNPTTTH